MGARRGRAPRALLRDARVAARPRADEAGRGDRAAAAPRRPRSPSRGRRSSATSTPSWSRTSRTGSTPGTSPTSRTRARRPAVVGRLPRRRLQPGRHPLAHVARPHGARAGRRAVAPRARRPAVGAGRLRRPARRHGLDGFAHRARRRARAGVPRRPEDGPRRPAAGRRLRLGARALLDRQGVRRPRASGPRACGRSPSTRSSGCGRTRSRRRSRRTAPPGRVPVAVVATAGTTTVTSRRSAARRSPDLCERERHLAPRRRGVRRARPRRCPRCARSSRAGSAPTRSSSTRTSGCSCRSSAPALFFRRMERVRRAFSVVPNYLETPEGQAACASTWTTASSSAAGSAP